MTGGWHVTRCPSVVRGVPLTRYAVSLPKDLDTPAPLFAVFGALGRPRLWQDVVNRAMSAFSEVSGSDLEVRVRLTQKRLSRFIGALVESEKPDATVTAVRLSPIPPEAREEGSHTLEILCAGAGRVYRYRNGAPVRLSPRKEGPDGLLRQPLVHTQATLQPGDVVLLGSVSAFSVRSMAHVAQSLHEMPDTPTTTLAKQLTGPPEQQGVGAAAIAIRV